MDNTLTFLHLLVLVLLMVCAIIFHIANRPNIAAKEKMVNAKISCKERPWKKVAAT